MDYMTGGVDHNKMIRIMEKEFMMMNSFLITDLPFVK